MNDRKLASVFKCFCRLNIKKPSARSDYLYFTKNLQILAPNFWSGRQKLIWGKMFLRRNRPS